jgi:glucosylceramidase
MKLMGEKRVLWIESTRDNYWQTIEPVESNNKKSNLNITDNKGRVVEGLEAVLMNWE